MDKVINNYFYALFSSKNSESFLFTIYIGK